MWVIEMEAWMGERVTSDAGGENERGARKDGKDGE